MGLAPHVWLMHPGMDEPISTSELREGLIGAGMSLQEPEAESPFRSLDFPSLSMDVEDMDIMVGEDDQVVAKLVFSVSGLQGSGKQVPMLAS